MPLSVEPAAEGGGQAADGEEAGAAVPQRAAGGVDVVGQDEAAARQAGRRQALQAVDIGDAVRRGGAAIAAQRAHEGGAGAEAEVGDAEAGQAGRQLAPGAAGEIQHTEVDAPVAGYGAGSGQGQAAVGRIDAIAQHDVAAVAGAEGQAGVVAPGQAVGNVEVAACRQLAGAADAEGAAAVEAEQAAGTEVGVQAVAGRAGRQVEAVAAAGEVREVAVREEGEVAVGMAAARGQVAAAGRREAALAGEQTHGGAVDVQPLDAVGADHVAEAGTGVEVAVQVGDGAIGVQAAGIAEDVVVAVRPAAGAADGHAAGHGGQRRARQGGGTGIAEGLAADGDGRGAVAPAEIRVEVGAGAPDGRGETGRQATLELGGGTPGDPVYQATGCGQRLATGLGVPVGVADGAIGAVVVADEPACLAAARDVARGVAVADGAVDEIDPGEAADVARRALADHRAGGVGVGDAAFVVADEAADRPRRRPHRAGGVGLADGTAITAVAVGAHQATDIAEVGGRVGAGDVAGGMGAGDAAAVDVEADQATDLVAGPGDIAGGGGIGDGAAVVGAHQPAGVGFAGAGAADRGAGRRVAEGAALHVADQGTDVVSAGDVAAHQPDVGQGRAGGVAEQADIVGGRAVDDQAADAVALSVEAAGELLCVAADRAEARRAPHLAVVAATGGHGAGQAQIGAQPVIGIKVQPHKLQGVGGEDGRGVFVAQHRPGIAFEHHPHVGEVEAGVGRLVAHSAGQPGAAAQRAGLAGAVDVPVAVVDDDGRQEAAADQAAGGGVAGDLAAGVGVGQRRAGDHLAQQPARKRAGVADRGGDRAGGIGVGHGNALHAARQPAHHGQAGHVGGRGRVADDAVVDRAGQAADEGAGAGHAAGHVNVAEGAAEGGGDAADVHLAGDAGIGQGQVTDVAAHGAEQPDVVLQPAVDGQLVDAVAKAGEVGARPVQRVEAGTAVPAGGGAGVDVVAQGVEAGAGDVLQRTDVMDQDVAGARQAEAGIAAGQGHAGALVQAVAAAVGQRQPGVVAGGGDVLVDDDAAGGVERQHGVGAPADGRVHGDVAGLAAADAGGHRHPGAGQGVAEGGDIEHAVVGVAVETAHAGACAVGNGHVVRVDQPLAGLAVGRQGGDPDVVVDLHVGAAGLDEAAITAVRGTGIEGAGDVHHAAVEVAHQQDPAVLLAQGAGFDHPGIVDHGLEQGIAGVGGEQHLAAIGLDQLVVLHQGIDHGLIDPQVEQAVAGEVQGHGIAGGQRHAALVGDDHAVVADLATEQGNGAACAGVERAVVDHRRIAAVALEAVVAGGEVGVADAQGGGDQAADVHLGAGAEQYAVGIDQEDPAIGVQLAHDQGAVDAEYAVERDRVRAGLVEGDLLPGTDVEALPVDRQFVAGLVDDQLVAAGRADLAAAGHDVAAGRQRLRHQPLAADGHQQAQRQWREPRAGRQAARGAARRAGRGTQFGGHLDLAQGAVEHETVDAIHGRCP